ncbi:hypothetical protein KR084_010111 [Drosophila pseudotakahashii]|nr:hypothetical protein KR084_010111 [Drosophila pseudotakahashii]
MNMRQRRSCWQQILTTVGIDTLPEEEWAAIYKGFMESWDNPYYIQASMDPNEPIRPEYLVRPRSALGENPSTPLAPDTRTDVFLEPTSSRLKAPNLNKSRGTISHSLSRHAPSSGQRRETIAHSVKEQRSLSSSQLRNPPESKSRGSTTKATSKKIRDASVATDSKVLSRSKLQDTCASPDPSTSNPHKSQESRASAFKTSSTKRRESCASSDDPVLSSVKGPKTLASKNTGSIKRQESRASAIKTSSTKCRESCASSDDPTLSSLKGPKTLASKNTGSIKSQESRASVFKTSSTKRRESCASSDDPTLSSLKGPKTLASKNNDSTKSQESRASVFKTSSTKRRESCALSDDPVLSSVKGPKTLASKNTGSIKRQESRASTIKTSSTKRRESCASSDDSILSSVKGPKTLASKNTGSIKSQESRASAFKTSFNKRRESCASSDDSILSSLKGPKTLASKNTGSIIPIKKRDSYVFSDAAAIHPLKQIGASGSNSVQRRNSCVPTQDSKSSSIKRRNTCVPTNAAQNTKLNPMKVLDSVASPTKNNKQRKNSSLPHKGSEESNDECDDQLPLSKWLVNKKNKEQKPIPIVVSIKKEPPAQDCNAAPPPVKRKRGRPSLHEKALQQARLEAELREAQQPSEAASKLNLMEFDKYSEARQTLKPKTQKPEAKPHSKAAQKQRKEIQQTPKASPQKKTAPHQFPKTPQTVVKTSMHGEITHQPQNLSKSALKKQPSKPRLQENAPNSPPNKKRTISNITAKSPLMPAHMPPTAINLKCPESGEPAAKDPEEKISFSRGQSNRRPSHLCEHNYNRSVDDKKPQGLPVPASNNIYEDPLLDELDNMHLASSLGGGEVSGGGIELMSDCDLLDTPIEMLREVEEIDRCLENFNNKTPSEIDSQLAHTTEFFEKLPSLSTVGEDKSDLVGIYMGEKEELNYEDDDDDVLSVAASWDGLDDEMALEPKPAEKSHIAVQEPKPISKPVKEPSERMDAVENPKVQNIKPFKIPKISPEELKTQPSVMRLLYKQDEMEKKKNLTAKPVPPLLVDPPLAASTRQQREEATAARRVKETLPVFAPPYRLPAESTVPLVNTSSQVFIPQLPVAPPPPQGNLSIRDIFGVKCMQSVDNMCRSFNCDHTLNSLGEVQRHLVRMDEETLVNTYRQMLRSFNLFQTFSTSFVDVYERRKFWQHLLNMLSDCRLYKDISAPLLVHVYGALYKCGMQEEAVRCIMQHLWLPCKAKKFQDMTLTVLRILSSANWENYFEKLEELKKVYDFDIPIENLITMLASSVDHGEKFRKALALIALHPKTCCRNETVMSILENKSGSEIQRPPVADTCPPSLIASHAAGQQCPPFRRHSAVPNFSVPSPPITAHIVNGNNGVQTSNEYSGHFNRPYKRI